MAFVTSSGDWICAGERLGETPDWKGTGQLACLAMGGRWGLSVQTALVLRGRVQLAWVEGCILWDGLPFRVYLGRVNCRVF